MPDLRQRMLARLATAPMPNQRPEREPSVPVRTTAPPDPPPNPRTEAKPRTHLYRRGVYWPDCTRGVCGAQEGRFERLSQFLTHVDCARCLAWVRRLVAGKGLDRTGFTPRRSPC